MNQTTDAAYIRQMLKACLEIPSPCGDTEEISQFLKKELEAMGIETRVTNKGAVIGILPGEKEGFSRMVSAHVDTLGAMVKRIKDNGRLRLENVGGYSSDLCGRGKCKSQNQGGKDFYWDIDAGAGFCPLFPGGCQRRRTNSRYYGSPPG